MYRTCGAESDRVVFQMVRNTECVLQFTLMNDMWLFVTFQVQGTADPERAVKTAKLVYVVNFFHDLYCTKLW